MSLRIAFDLDGTLADLDSALDRIAEELFPARPEEGAAEQAAANPAEAGSHESRSDDRPDGKGYWAQAGAQAATGGSSKVGAPDEGEALSAEEEQLEPPKVRALTRRQQHAIWDAVRRTTNFWETLDEIEPGIVARLAAIAEERRWEVLFITQRPACDGGTQQRQTQRWLAKHGFELPSVFVLGAGASRGKVATALALDIVVDDRPENCLDIKVDSHARAFLVSRTQSATVGANARRLGIEVVSSIAELLDLLTAVPPEKPTLLGRLKRAIGV